MPLPLNERIRAVGIALGEFAGRVTPDDWRALSALRHDLAGLANEAEWLENLRDTSMAEADGALPDDPQAEARKPAKTAGKSGKTAREDA